MEPQIKDKLITVAVNIRDYRLYKKHSQEYIAGSLGISQKAYSKIELGSAKLTFEMLYKIAGILGVPVSDLLGVPSSHV